MSHLALLSRVGRTSPAMGLLAYTVALLLLGFHLGAKFGADHETDFWIRSAETWRGYASAAVDREEVYRKLYGACRERNFGEVTR